MSLQEASSLPPNKIIDERRNGNRGSGYRSARRLSQLAQRAVDKALKLQAESGRLVDVVDTQICGELGAFGCSIKYPFPPTASKLLKTTTFLIPSSSSQSWTLPKESQDRRVVAKRIYSFLIQWKSDVSFEWRSRALLAVPVLEEALYRVAKCKEEYVSQELLEHVLLHFEAGNGLFLLQGTKPLYSLMDRDISKQINCVTAGTCEITHVDALEWENCVTADSCESTHGDALPWDNTTVLDANDSGSRSDPKPSLINKNSSKRITKRVVNMLSKTKSDTHTRLSHEITKSIPQSAENIPSAGVIVHDARIEIRNDDKFCEPSHVKQESPCYVDARARKSSRKTLGDMMNFKPTNLPSVGSSLSINVDEARLVSFMNKDSNCSKQSDMVRSFCAVKADPMATVAKGPFPSSSNVADAECSSIDQMQPSSDEAEQSAGLCLLQGLPIALISSPSHTATLQPSPSTPKLKTSAWWPVHSIAPSAASFLSSSPSSLTSPSTALSTLLHVTSSSSSSTTTSSLSLAPSSSHVSSSSSSLSVVSSSSPSLSPELSSSSSHTADRTASTSLKLAPSSRPTGLLIQLLHHTPRSPAFHEGEQNEGLEEQFPAATATTPHEIEREAARRSTTMTPTAASTDSSAEARERGARFPLSHFLSERDEFVCTRMADISGDSACSSNTWEEPTAQIDPLCCVCMVGLKGAAFIPCGHTFCRRCSRELWRGRRSCPLCNRYIRDILDVY